MHIFDFYRTPEKREELKLLLDRGAQLHPDGLPDFFLEKDLWVTEILRLLYDENLLGDYAVAFKGGTALSKCWKVIDRFSEDIDLSIHWADLAGADDESAAWEQSTKSRSQRDKFRDQQTTRLEKWSSQLADKLNQRFADYGIEELAAKLEIDSQGEKINIHFPRVTESENNYHLDHVLLEFGGRNRGQPTVAHYIGCYMAEISELQAFTFPSATVQAYDPSYIMWEKLTALHQFSTMEKEPKTHRLARHWHDVDCLLRKGIVDPLSNKKAQRDVVEMKKQRWAEKGVDYELAIQGRLALVPNSGRLKGIADDHKEAIQGRMFFIHQQPDDFKNVLMLNFQRKQILRFRLRISQAILLPPGSPQPAPEYSGSAPTPNFARTKSVRISDVRCRTQKTKALANAHDGSPIGVGDDCENISKYSIGVEDDGINYDHPPVVTLAVPDTTTQCSVHPSRLKKRVTYPARGTKLYVQTSTQEWPCVLNGMTPRTRSISASMASTSPT